MNDFIKVKKPKQKIGSSAFSLVELLIVVVIIAILLALTTPFILGSIAASRLTTAGEIVLSTISSAQQIASTEGCTIEVKFLSTPEGAMSGGDTEYRSMMLLRRYEIGEPSPDPSSGNKGKPLTAPISLIIGQVVNLPEGVVFGDDSNSSTILSTPALKTPVTGSGEGAPKIIAGGAMANYQFQSQPDEAASFVIRPEGTNLNPSAPWFVTLTSLSDVQKSRGNPTEWKNFFCIQVDPINGRAVSYRP